MASEEEEDKRLKLCESLMIWVKSFNVCLPCESIGDLTNGVLIAEILHGIDPAWFDSSWKARIKMDVRDNKRLKVSNLKKVLERTKDYCDEVLYLRLDDDAGLDTSCIADGDTGEMGRLLQMVLACAVNCDRKQGYIEAIMGLEESVQHVLMAALQELLNKNESECEMMDGRPELEAELQKALASLSEAQSEKEEMAQRCHELDRQVCALMEDRNNLLADKELLTDQLNRSDFSEGPVERRQQNLQSQFELLQEETFRLEVTKDEYRLRCEKLERTMAERQEEHGELAAQATAAQRLHDELEIARAEVQRLPQLEATVDGYRQRLAELGELRRQVKLLEERNAQAQDRAAALSTELQLAQSARSQLEVVRNQVIELEERLQVSGSYNEQLASRISTLQEKHDALQKERERLLVERANLKEANEELRCTQLQSAELESESNNLAKEIIPGKVREFGLIEENRALQMKQDDLEHDNRLLTIKLQELQAELRALQQKQSQAEESTLLKQKLQEHMQSLAQEHTELQRKRLHIDELDSTIPTDNRQHVEELKMALAKKDEELKMVEDRYKRYLQKAKSVIRTMDVRRVNTSPPELYALQNQLQEKERALEALQSEKEHLQIQQQHEQKLMMTAWYNMGITLQTDAIDSRLSGSPINNHHSFLGHQRQVSNLRRPPIIPHSQGDLVHRNEVVMPIEDYEAEMQSKQSFCLQGSTIKTAW
uniref:Calponin-homology (CH) domain-containing protein n=1 Tax=Eptatretus burgeri TaxID=7764 RepID=A0A8C4QFN7_EPTBU